MKKKPKVLLCWGYNRNAWVETFNKINDHFDFTYLYFINKPNDEVAYVKDPIRYWAEFQSPAQILKELKPERVVLMATNAVNVIALMNECKRQKIPTYVLQHGLFHDYAFYVEQNRLEQERVKKLNYTAKAISISNADRAHLFLFYLKSLSVGQLEKGLKFIFKYQLDKRRMLDAEAIRANQSEFLLADQYIVYTKHNAHIYVERDGVNPDQMIEVGFPQVDRFFDGSKPVNTGDYYLLIDEPHVEAPFFDSVGIVSAEEMNAFYLKLNEYALRKGKKLKVKLHPDSYASTFFINHPNIEYIRETDNIDALVLNSAGVFGYTSTLLIPSLYYKKCCLFRIINSEFQNTIEKIGLSPVVDFFEFDLDKVGFEEFVQKPNAKQKFIDLYLYKADGMATERIKNILLGVKAFRAPKLAYEAS